MKNSKLRRLTTLAVLGAVSIALTAIIHFPLIPAVSFLEYDPADIPILIAGFALGPVPAILLTFAAAVIQGLTVSAQSGPYGIIMHIIATSFLVSASSMIYKKHKTKKGAAVSVAAGIVAMTLIMIPANLIVTPFFMGVPRAAVSELMVYIILFNLIKASVNGFATYLVYKKISPLIHAFND